MTEVQHTARLDGLGLRLLAASARHGSALLATGIFAGLLVPPLAHAFRIVIAPQVVGLVTLILLRVDIPAAFAHLRRPLRLAGVVAFQLLACPVLASAVVHVLPIERGIANGVVIFSTGCAATSSPAFARLVNLDPELTLLATLATTLLVPLTAPPIAYALMGVDLAISMLGFMARLLLMVGLPLLLSLALRRIFGPERLEPYGPAFDGIVVWLVVFYGFGVMDGTLARVLADPRWVGVAAIAAFAANFGLNFVSAAAFAWIGKRAAASVGLMSGNRNMALYFAVLPAAADPRVALFIVICQFPLFLSPFLLRPV
ncbi:MAG: hypothetical protein JO209_07565, partial [Acidisphaera sp.]|nr:hypothetical protein [Acidisphaera sp.]